MDRLELHRCALRDAGLVVLPITTTQAESPSTCGGWTVGDLLAHMIGQHHGIANAVRGGTAEADEYDPRPFTVAAWRRSAVDLQEAFASTAMDWQVELVEWGRTMSVAEAMDLHTLVTAVHTWDVATSLGKSYEPSMPALVALVGDLAGSVASGERGEALRGRFGPALDAGGSPWQEALGRLGRSSSK